MLRLPDAEFLDEILTKVVKVYLLAIYSHFYSFAMRFLFLQTHATSYICSSVLGLVTVLVQEKGGKPYRIQNPLPYGLRNPYRNLKVSELSRLCLETSTKLYVNSASGMLVRIIFDFPKDGENLVGEIFLPEVETNSCHSS